MYIVHRIRGSETWYVVVFFISFIYFIILTLRNNRLELYFQLIQAILTIMLS